MTALPQVSSTGSTHSIGAATGAARAIGRASGRAANHLWWFLRHRLAGVAAGRPLQHHLAFAGIPVERFPDHGFFFSA